MKATIGDRIVVRGHRVGEPERTGEVLEIKGDEGAPPYLVKWSDGHQALVHPGSDAFIDHS